MDLRRLTHAATSFALMACGHAFMDFPGTGADGESATDAGSGAVDAGADAQEGASTISVGCAAPPCTAKLRIAAGVDGTSDLVLKGNSLFWHHLEYVPPNRTRINDVEWRPSWPPGAVSCGGCDSDATTFSPALPARAQRVSVSLLAGRTPIRTEQPATTNDFTLTVHFDDSPSGPDDYEILIEYEP